MKFSFIIFAKILIVPVIEKFFIGRIEGKENIPENTNFILASNHQNNLDHLLIACVLKRRLRKVRFIGKMEGILQFFLFGFFYFITETIPIDRRKKDKRRILDKAINYLKRGCIIIIYPEGMRNKKNKLKEGKTGAAELSIRSGFPVVPFGISNSGNIKNILKIGKPIFPENKKGILELGKEKETKLLRLKTNKIMEEISLLCGKNVAL